MVDLPPPDPGIEIVLASRGVSKGLVQTDGVQLLVRPEVAFGPLVIGAYAKNVTSTTSDGEYGPSAGLRHSIGPFSLAASATWKRLVDPVGPVDNDALELDASASRRLGPVTLRAGLTWSPDDLGSTGETAWWESRVSWKVHERVTLQAALGRRERDGGPDYTGFNGAAGIELVPGVTAELRYYGTSRSALGDAFSDHLIGAVRLRF